MMPQAKIAIAKQAEILQIITSVMMFSFSRLRLRLFLRLIFSSCFLASSSLCAFSLRFLKCSFSFGFLSAKEVYTPNPTATIKPRNNIVKTTLWTINPNSDIIIPLYISTLMPPPYETCHDKLYYKIRFTPRSQKSNPAAPDISSPPQRRQDRHGRPRHW